MYTIHSPRRFLCLQYSGYTFDLHLPPHAAPRSSRIEERLWHGIRILKGGHCMVGSHASISPDPPSSDSRSLDGESTQLHSGSVPHLPRQLTRFVGRTDLITQLTEQLASGLRLLTITGPGGSGKTRLAIEVANQAQELFPGGQFLVELAAVTDENAVTSHVASALRLRLRADRSLTDAVNGRFDEPMLVILDNCEHLIGACAQLVTELLEVTDCVRVLATSRESLAVEGEVVQPLEPLRVPKEDDSEDIEALRGVESVQLFVDRAKQRDPNFALTEENAQAVAEICRRLDGIPLAIELAAALSNVLTPDEIVDRLGDRFQILNRSRRTALPRQRTFRALVDWSYHLLTEAQQLLWQRLSVFEPDVELESVEAVVSDDRLPAEDVFYTLARLVDKSVVMVSTDEGVTRYRMLQTLRQYGLQRLEETGQVEAFRLRHRNHYAAVIGRINDEYREQYTGLAPILPEVRSRISNITAAIRYSMTQPASPVTIGMSFPLAAFYYANGQQTYGYELLKQIVDLPGSQGETSDRALVLIGMGQLARIAGRGEEAVARVKEGLGIARVIGDVNTIQVGLIQLTQVLPSEDSEQKIALLEELLSSATHWSKVVTAHAILTYQYLCLGDRVQARSHAQRGLEAAAGHEGTYAHAYVSAMSGFVAMASGDVERAGNFLRTSLEYMKANHRSNATEVWLMLARAYQLHGEERRALQAMRQALTVLHDTLHDPGITENFVPLVFLLCADFGFDGPAASLLDGAQQRSASTFDFAEQLRQQFDTAAHALRSRLSKTELSAAAAGVSAGNSRTWLPSVMRELDSRLSQLDTSNGKGGVTAGGGAQPVRDLTKRETTVLRMVSKGQSNKEIAAELYLTEGTVRTYLSRVYDKLGAKSRTDAVAKAVELGLWEM